MDVFHRLSDHHEPVRENFLLYFVGGVGHAHVYSGTPQQQMSFCSAPAYLLFPAALLPMFAETGLAVLTRLLQLHIDSQSLLERVHFAARNREECARERRRLRP